jgi:uncharacterized protein YegJ (DUF2314 family)
MTEATNQPVFIPMLGAILLAAEDKKGAPLTEAEVLSVRDSAACMMMTPEHAAALAATRGNDLDPENVWFDFQALRRALGRKPDIDAGARVAVFANDDAEMKEAVRRARDSADELRRWIDSGAEPLVKTLIVQEKSRTFTWLADARVAEGGFSGVVFEVPPGLVLRKGERLEVPAQQLADWMCNVDGTMHGAFSLRVHRARLSEDKRAEFDEHIGALRWA